MRDPPHGDKQCQQQAVEPLVIADQAGFQIPATTLAVLKGGFHAHAPAVLPYPSSPSRLIGDQEPGFFVARLPDGTQVGLDALLLPEPDASKPLLPRCADQCSTGLPVPPAPADPASSRMLGTDAQEVMPPALATQLHQRRTTEATVRDQRTVSAS